MYIKGKPFLYTGCLLYILDLPIPSVLAEIFSTKPFGEEMHRISSHFCSSSPTDFLRLPFITEVLFFSPDFLLFILFSQATNLTSMEELYEKKI